MDALDTGNITDETSPCTPEVIYIKKEIKEEVVSTPINDFLDTESDTQSQVVDPLDTPNVSTESSSAITLEMPVSVLQNKGNEGVSATENVLILQPRTDQLQHDLNINKNPTQNASQNGNKIILLFVKRLNSTPGVMKEDNTQLQKSSERGLGKNEVKEDNIQLQESSKEFEKNEIQGEKTNRKVADCETSTHRKNRKTRTWNLIDKSLSDDECVTGELNSTKNCNAAVKKTSPTERKKYTCSYCNYTANIPAHIKQHERSHTGEKPYLCDVCGKTFAHVWVLNDHLKIHTGEATLARYVCDICGKAFVTSSGFRQHLKIHTGVKRYVCNICEKKFTKLSGLKDHIVIHSSLKPYTCDNCNKSFSRLGNLRSHIKYHTGKEKTICNASEKKFNSNSELNDHSKIHSNETDAFLRYVCDFSEKTCGKSSCFKQYLRTHTGEKRYVCNICEKEFKKLSGFKDHIVIHSNIKPYTCITCNKSFSRPGNLRSHIKYHTGEKQAVCNACEKKFHSDQELKSHSVIHTGEKPFI